MPLKQLALTFNLPIYPRQIKQWRGAFIEMAGWTDDLFHNHKGEDGYHYRYPLIQYRVMDKKAAIMAIGDGVEVLQKVLSDQDWEINWQGEKVRLQIHDLRMQEHALRWSRTPKTYRLFRYLPFKTENYERWKACTNLTERVNLLESIITGHLLGYARAMDWPVDETIKVDLQYIQLMEKVRYHETHLLAFNLTYSCNLALPEGIGLGRGISHGFGRQIILRPDRQKYIHQQYEEKAADQTQPAGQAAGLE